MRLYKYELYKSLVSRYGIALLLVCALGKAFLLFFVPEAKDPRIALSQKQYDYYLEGVRGEDSDEKRSRIKQEYEECLAVINSWEKMSSKRNQGELNEKEWSEYVNLYDKMVLRQNTLEIFFEKVSEFEKTPDNVALPYYIYEYGWETVFKLMKFPDLFFLIFTIVFSICVFSIEVQSGMREIILSSKNGRKKLYICKCLIVLSVLTVAAILFAVEEYAIFSIRGFLNNGYVPIYSLTLFSGKCYFSCSLTQCFIGGLLFRSIGAVCLGTLIMSTTILSGKSGTTFVISVVYITVTTVMVFWGWSTSLFFHSSLLCPTNSLIVLYNNGWARGASACIVCVWSLGYTCMAGYLYDRKR